MARTLQALRLNTSNRGKLAAPAQIAPTLVAATRDIS